MQRCFPYCLLNLKSQRHFPIFSSRGFIVFSFISRSMIYFELTFVCGVRYRSNVFLFFPLCIWKSNHSSIIYWKDNPFFLLNILLSFVKWLYICGSISGLYFFHIDLFAYLHINTILFWSFSFWGAFTFFLALLLWLEPPVRFWIEVVVSGYPCLVLDLRK